MHMKFKHFIPIQIRINDIDIMGHVNNAAHQEYFDYGRMRYFEDVLHQEILGTEFPIIIAHIEVDYDLPVFINDDIEARTRIIRIGKKSITFEQQMFDSVKQVVKSTGKTVMVAYDYKKGVSIPVPDDWKILIRYYEENDDL
ncbi:acyl-CoA thioesterase [Bacteroidota bacterium]